VRRFRIRQASHSCALVLRCSPAGGSSGTKLTFPPRRYFTVEGQARRGTNDSSPTTAWSSRELYETTRAATAADGGCLNYTLPVAESYYSEPNASLVLTLKLAELKASTQPGQRVFDVFVNDMLAVSGVDVAEMAAWRDRSASRSPNNSTAARLQDIHVQLDVQHGGWFVRVRGKEVYAGFFGELRVSLRAAEGVNVRLMPHLCALLLTSGSVKDAPQTLPFEHGNSRTLPGETAELQGDVTNPRSPAWLNLGSALVALALGGVTLWPKNAEAKAKDGLTQERDARKRKRQQRAKLAQQQFSAEQTQRQK